MLVIGSIGTDKFSKKFTHEGREYTLEFTVRSMTALDKMRLVQSLRYSIASDVDFDDELQFESAISKLASRRRDANERISTHIEQVEGVSFPGDRTWQDLSLEERMLLMESNVWSSLFMDGVLEHYLQQDREVEETQGKSEKQRDDT